MKKKTKAILFQLPGEILLIIAFVISLFVKLLNLYTLTWFTPIVLGLILGFYFWGKRLEKHSFFEKYGY